MAIPYIAEKPLVQTVTVTTFTQNWIYDHPKMFEQYVNDILGSVSFGSKVTLEIKDNGDYVFTKKENQCKVDQ